MKDTQVITEVARSEREGTPVCFTCGGKVLAYSTGGSVQLYDIETRQEKDYFFALNVNWMASDIGHQIVAAGSFTEVWDVEHCELLWQLPEYTTLKHGNICPAVADISLDGTKLVVAGSNTTQAFIYDLQQNAVIQTLNSSPLQAKWISLSPDLRHLAVGTYINGVFIWNLETGEQVLSDKYNLGLTHYTN